MPNPTLGVMTLYLEGGRIEELSYFRKLTEAGEKLGLSVLVFTPEDVDDHSNQIRVWVYDLEAGKWGRKMAPMPDIIYDRCRFQRNYRFRQLRKFRSDYPNLIYMSRPLLHKWGIHQLLSKSKQIRPYLPDTQAYQNVSGLLRMLDQHGLVYVKPIDGTGGRGIIRIERSADKMYRVQGRDRKRRIIVPFTVARDQLGARLSKWNLLPRYLMQQGIRIMLKDGRVHDFRLLIQKNGLGEWEVTGCAGRVGGKNSITSNLHGGGRAVTTRRLLRMRFGSDARSREIEADMERLARYTVSFLERQFGSLCELALDIAVDESGKVWLLEINPKPAREVFSRTGETDIYQKAINRPLEYALYLLKQNGKG